MANKVLTTGDTSSRPHERTLFKDDPIETTYEDIKVADIEKLIPDAAKTVTQPTAAFIENVAQNGIIHPIILIKKGKKFDLADGRRRIIAAQKCGLATIAARIWPAGYSRLAVLTLSTNEQRKSNIVAEYQAIEKLIADGDSVDDIIMKTGVPKQKITKLLNFRELVPDLMKGFLDGSIKAGVALKASKQKKPIQRQLVTIYQETGTLHGTDIVEIRKKLKDTTVIGLPDTLFAALPDEWKDRAYYALTTLKTQVEGMAPAEFLADLDALILQSREV